MSVRPADMEERARLLAMSVAATSIADTAGFLTDLHKRIDESILRAVWVLPQIRKLSQSDDAFLVRFLRAKSCRGVARNARRVGPRVRPPYRVRRRAPRAAQTSRARRPLGAPAHRGALARVPRRRAHAARVGGADGDQALDAHLARLRRGVPPPAPPTPAATLQSDGALDRRIVKFLDECAALVVSARRSTS